MTPDTGHAHADRQGYINVFAACVQVNICNDPLLISESESLQTSLGESDQDISMLSILSSSLEWEWECTSSEMFIFADKLDNDCAATFYIQSDM